MTKGVKLVPGHKALQCHIKFDETRATHYQSLYLDSLQEEERERRLSYRKHQVKGQEPATSKLSVADIDKASPTKRTKHVKHVYQLEQALAKVFLGESGMHPKRLHPVESDKPDLRLDIKDIPGSQSKPKEAFAGNRSTNPLNPEYKLPAGPEEQVPPPPKFIRNAMDTSDISGSRPVSRSRPRSGRLSHSGPLDVADIEGAEAGWRQRVLLATPPRDTVLNVTDINGVAAWAQRLQREPKPSNYVRDIEGARNAVTDPDRVRQLWEQQRQAAREQEQTQQRAQQILSSLAVQRDALEGFWASCKAVDRQGSGKVTSGEFARLLTAARMDVSGEQLQVVVQGMQDRAGLLDYRAIAKKLLMTVIASDKSRREPSGAASSTQPRGRPCSAPSRRTAVALVSRAGGTPTDGETVEDSRPLTARAGGCRPWAVPPSSVGAHGSSILGALPDADRKFASGTAAADSSRVDNPAAARDVDGEGMAPSTSGGNGPGAAPATDATQNASSRPVTPQDASYARATRSDACKAATEARVPPPPLSARGPSLQQESIAQRLQRARPQSALPAFRSSTPAAASAAAAVPQAADHALDSSHVCSSTQTDLDEGMTTNRAVERLQPAVKSRPASAFSQEGHMKPFVTGSCSPYTVLQPPSFLLQPNRLQRPSSARQQRVEREQAVQDIADVRSLA